MQYFQFIITNLPTNPKNEIWKFVSSLLEKINIYVKEKICQIDFNRSYLKKYLT